MRLRSFEKTVAMMRIRNVAVLAMGMIAVSSAHAGSLYVTITGTWGTFTTGPNISTTAFDNGGNFSFSTTITSFTPVSFNSTRADLPTTGGSYSDGGVTRPISAFEQLTITDPAFWNGQNFGFGVHDVFVAGDFLALYFNGPALFTGSTSAPMLSAGTFVGQEAWYGYSGQYLGAGPSNYSYAQLAGDATITLSNTPEPSTGALMALALGAALFQFRFRISQWNRTGTAQS